MSESPPLERLCNPYKLTHSISDQHRHTEALSLLKTKPYVLIEKLRRKTEIKLPGSTQRGNLSAVAVLRPLPALITSSMTAGSSPAFVPITRASDVIAGLAIIQWQSGIPLTIYPDDLAMAKPLWPKKQ